MNVFKARAENLIRALRESPDPSKFSMHTFVRECGTPACVLGHYAVRRDLQDVFYVEPQLSWTPIRNVDGSNAVPMGHYSQFLLDHFGITNQEAYDLFSTKGCGKAQTVEKAITYIEGFIAEKWPEDPAARKLIDELNHIEEVKELENECL